jgi:serine/threonine protein kinase
MTTARRASRNSLALPPATAGIRVFRDGRSKYGERRRSAEFIDFSFSSTIGYLRCHFAISMAVADKFKSGMLFGRWTLNKEIGHGGNGVVWEAHNSEGAAVAIKFLKGHHFSDHRAQRFRSEVEFLQKEKDRPGILPLIDANVPELFSDTDRPWFTTPLAVPFSTQDLKGTDNLIKLVERIATVAETLTNLHDERKWHRDIKPQNLFTLNGRSVIGDFGLIDFPDKDAITTNKEFMGPLFYIAPEMMENAANTEAGPADVYSLAKTLWTLSAGQRYPLQGEQRIDTAALRLSSYSPHLRAGMLDLLIQRSTSTMPRERPTMLQFANELKALLTPLPDTPDKLDTQALAKIYEGDFARVRLATQNSDQLKQATNSIILTFKMLLSRIAGEISQLTKTRTGIQEHTPNVPDRLHYKGSIHVVSRHASEVLKTVGEQDVACIESFAQVEALQDDTIRVVVGHIVQRSYAQSVIQYTPIWERECVGYRGSAALEAGVNALRTGLQDNFPEAMRAFAEIVRGL